MPVSDVNNIAPILNEVVRLQPKHVLELGIGLGKYGVLVREVLDGVRGFTRPCQDTTSVEIWGAEGFDSYRNPAWGQYDGIIIRDFSTLDPPYFQASDLVMLIDSLEHLEKDKALDFLRVLVANTNNVIVSVPLGNCPQGAVFGNEFERHRSSWDGREFAEFESRVLYKGVCLVVSIKGKGN
jgi:hypothetical protein